MSEPRWVRDHRRRRAEWQRTVEKLVNAPLHVVLPARSESIDLRNWTGQVIREIPLVDDLYDYGRRGW